MLLRYLSLWFLYRDTVWNLVLGLDHSSMYSLLNLKDVLFVDSGDPWNPRPETVNKVMSMLQQVHRVLKPNGIFISITFGQVVGMWKQETFFFPLNSNHSLPYTLAMLVCEESWILLVVIMFFLATFPTPFLQGSRIYLVYWLENFWWWISLFPLHLEKGQSWKNFQKVYYMRRYFGCQFF